MLNLSAHAQACLATPTSGTERDLFKRYVLLDALDVLTRQGCWGIQKSLDDYGYPHAYLKQDGLVLYALDDVLGDTHLLNNVISIRDHLQEGKLLSHQDVAYLMRFISAHLKHVVEVNPNPEGHEGVLPRIFSAVFLKKTLWDINPQELSHEARMVLASFRTEVIDFTKHPKSLGKTLIRRTYLMLPKLMVDWDLYSVAHHLSYMLNILYWCIVLARFTTFVATEHDKSTELALRDVILKLLEIQFSWLTEKPETKKTNISSPRMKLPKLSIL